MSLTDLIETWLRSKPAIGWGVYRYPNRGLCDYVFCREHSWPMIEGDDYIVAIFTDHIAAFTRPIIEVQAGDPLFLDKLWHILDNHYKEYHH
jgi:hypothetical protein